MIILGGLPGVISLARALARQIVAVHVRIDAIEMSLREAGALVGPMDDRPTWDEVLARDHAPWDRENVAIDTARVRVEQNARTVRELLDRRQTSAAALSSAERSSLAGAPAAAAAPA